MSPRGRRHSGLRRGSLYVLVLMVSVLMMAIGLGGLALQRVHSRLNTLRQDWHDTGLLAQSAAERALLKINGDQWWRQVYADNEGVYTAEMAFGRGFISWQVDDLVDDDLDDNDGDPIRVYGRGRIGQAQRVFSIAAWPSGQSLDVLRTACHVSGDLDIRDVLDPRSGPASCAGTIDVTDGQVLGDVEATAVVAPQNVNGAVLTPAPPQQLPARAIWGAYQSIATPIGFGGLFGGVLDDTVVSPQHHPTEQDPNSYGLYLIKVPASSTLRIRRCRIEGTLLVELGESAKLFIEPDVVWRPARPDFPALMVYTKKDMGTAVDISCSGALSEFAAGVNFNPPETPYYGSSDDDIADTYPASIRGVIHVMRDVVGSPSSKTTIRADRKITGCLIIEGDAVVLTNSKLAADPTLLSHPPLGYTTSPAPDNLLVNGGAEAGLAGWVGVGAATVAWKNSNSHSGSGCLEITDRTGPWEGLGQDVTSALVSDEIYQSELWLRMKDDPEDVIVTLVLESSGDGTQNLSMTVPAVGTAWTRLIVEHAVAWTGTLTSAQWRVATTSTAQGFLFDDANLRPTSNGPPAARLTPIPGSWSAVASP